MSELTPEQIADDFKGDNEHLVNCIKALIALNDDGALVPHGLGGHARALLSAAAARLSPDKPDPTPKAVATFGYWIDPNEDANSEPFFTFDAVRAAHCHKRGEIVTDLFTHPDPLSANLIKELVQALERSRPYIEDEVNGDGGIYYCDIGYRVDLEKVDAALAKAKAYRSGL